MSHRAIDDYFNGRCPTPRMEDLNLVSVQGYGLPAAVHPPTGLGPAGEQAHNAHWYFMQQMAALGAHARIVRPSSRRHTGETEGRNEKPCECVRTLRMRVYETQEDNPEHMSRIRNPTYVSSGHFLLSLR